MNYVYLAAGWVASNVVALGVGAVAGYMFGPKALAYLKALVNKVV